MKALPLLALVPSLVAQSLCINSGGPSIPPPTTSGCGFTADQYSVTGNIWGPGAPGYIPLPTGIWADLRYGPSFTYDIPVANGLYSIKFDLIEPTQSAANLRRFTINANGVQSQALDLFALTGGLGIPYSITLGQVPVTIGVLHIAFSASIRSAVVSAIEITALPSSPPPNLGVPCETLQAGALYIVLPDRSCLGPIEMKPGAAFNPRAAPVELRYWWDARGRIVPSTVIALRWPRGYIR